MRKKKKVEKNSAPQKTVAALGPLPERQNTSLTDRLSKRFIMALLVIFSALSFGLMPVTQVTDSQFSLLLSRAIAFDHTTRLDTYLNPTLYKPQKGFFYWYWQLSPKRNGKVEADHSGDWWGNEELYYRYPTLPSILAIPAVVVLDLMGLPIVDVAGNYQQGNEKEVHRILAAILAGLIIAVLFSMASMMMPIPWAIFSALLLGLGTQIISTLSRGVWSDTWAVLWALVAIHHLVAHALRHSTLSVVYVGVVSAIAFFCKPLYAVVGMAAFLYVFRTASTRQWALLMAVGGALFAAFIGYSLWNFGTLVPNYYIPDFQWQYVPEALKGHLFSPSRGLLVYSPFLIWVIAMLWLLWKYLPTKSLLWVALIPITIIMAVSSAWGAWWGGHSYGPRLITPLVPWLSLLTIMAIAAFGHSLNSKGAEPFSWEGILRYRLRSGLLALTAAISIFIHVHGATEPKTWLEWFYKPYPVFNDPVKRIWDWRDAQFMAGIVTRPHERTE